MNVLEMRQPVTKASPLFQARVAGACWLLTIVAGVFGMYVWSSLAVSGDAAATATNILSNKAFFRAGTAATLISVGGYLSATLFAYELLKPVNRPVSLLAAFFSLVGCAVLAVSSLFDFTPFSLLRGDRYLGVFTSEQLQAFSFMFLRLGRQTYNIGMIFFGMHILLLGYLILKSDFLPRIVGGLLMFGGLCYLTFLAPPLAGSLSPYNLVPGGLGEITLALWLLVKGVNVGRWNEQAGVNQEK